MVEPKMDGLIFNKTLFKLRIGKHVHNLLNKLPFGGVKLWIIQFRPLFIDFRLFNTIDSKQVTDVAPFWPTLEIFRYFLFQHLVTLASGLINKYKHKILRGSEIWTEATGLEVKR